jgi:hypothetical protein
MTAIGCVLFPSADERALSLSGWGSSSTLIFCVSRPSIGSVSGAPFGGTSDGTIAGSRIVRTSPAGPRIAAGVYGFVRMRPPGERGGTDDVLRTPGGIASGRVELPARTCGGSAVMGVGTIEGGGVAVGSTTTAG